MKTSPRQIILASAFAVLSLLPATVQAQFNYAVTNGTITVTGYTGPSGDVTIPDTTNGLAVTSIGYGAFYGCTSLSAITVDAHNPAYSSVDGVLFNKNQTKLIQCPSAKAGSYTIPDCVTSIGDDAFYECTRLTSVAIPDSVTLARSIGRLINPSLDGLERIYEYILGEFARTEGQKRGEFYTPSCIVRLLTEVIEPYHGRIPL